MEKETILKIFTKEDGSINASRAKESYIKKNYVEVYNFISSLYGDEKFSHKLWCYINDRKDMYKCPVCGNDTKFISVGQGFKENCSQKCANKNTSKQDKIRNTCLKKYGVTNAAKSDVVKEKTKNTNLDRHGHVCSLHSEENKKKTKKTIKERYGVEHHSQNEEVKSKVKKTIKERYGVEHQSQSQVVKDKTKKTVQERYGVDHVSQTQEFKDKVKKTFEEKYGYHPFNLKENREKAIERAHSDEANDKRKSTNLEKHGVEHVFQSDEIKQKIKETNLEKYGHENSAHGEEAKKKIEETNIERYGFKNAAKNEDIKNKIKETNIERYGGIAPVFSEEIKSLIRSTNLEKYGVEHVFQSEEIKDKIKKACLEKYGVDNPMKSDQIKKVFRQIFIDKRMNILLEMGFKEENILDASSDIVIHCDNCDSDYNTSLGFLRQRSLYEVEACTNCNPIGGSSATEIELLEYVQNKYNGEIIHNDRTVLEGKELDIYLPDLNLAFEFNRVYWHSEAYKSSKYHLEKTELCLEKNVHLIHVYEDNWNYKKDIVKSRIDNLLKISKRLYARKCIIKEVDFKESKKFLIDNHIQGNVNGKIRLGLYHPDKKGDYHLASLMTFGSLRKSLGQTNKEGSYELLRFCNRRNYTVVGGADRLFKHFLKTYNPVDVISYADRSWSKGGLYEQLGFEYMKSTGANYFYVVGGIRRNRFNYRKDILVKEGYDSNMTEHEIMLSRDIYRIYDSGSLKYIFHNS